MSLREQLYDICAPSGVKLADKIKEAKKAILTIKAIHPDVKELTIYLRGFTNEDIQNCKEGNVGMQLILGSIESYYCIIEVSFGFYIKIFEQ